jgi:hypothetical protein
MKVPAVCLVSFGVLASLTLSTEAFSVRQPHASFVLDTTKSRSGCNMMSLEAMAARGRRGDQQSPSEAMERVPRRRQFLVESIQKVAVAVAAASASSIASTAGVASAADVFEDLAMPTEAEQKQQDEVSTFDPLFLFLLVMILMVCSCEPRRSHLLSFSRRPTPLVRNIDSILDPVEPPSCLTRIPRHATLCRQQGNIYFSL